MTERLLVISFASEASPAARQEIADAYRAALDGAERPLVAPTLPGVYNGGDLIVRASFADEAAAAAFDRRASEMLGDQRIVTHVEYVTFELGRSGGKGAAGLYRVALFCANRAPDPARLARFADDTAAMPDFIPAIGRWALSEPSSASGARPWTHVWEQEYPDRAGLERDYMLHPIHWAHVERWFDTEYPESLVDPVLVHTFCAINAPVLKDASEI